MSEWVTEWVKENLYLVVPMLGVAGNPWRKPQSVPNIGPAWFEKPDTPLRSKMGSLQYFQNGNIFIIGRSSPLAEARFPMPPTPAKQIKIPRHCQIYFKQVVQYIISYHIISCISSGYKFSLLWFEWGVFCIPALTLRHRHRSLG